MRRRPSGGERACARGRNAPPAEGIEAMFATRWELRSNSQRVAKSGLRLKTAQNCKRSPPLPRGRTGKLVSLCRVCVITPPARQRRGFQQAENTGCRRPWPRLRLGGALLVALHQGPPAISAQPSASTKNASLNGRAITAGGTIIIPIDISTAAITRSMIRKGRKSGIRSQSLAGFRSAESSGREC